MEERPEGPCESVSRVPAMESGVVQPFAGDGTSTSSALATEGLKIQDLPTKSRLTQSLKSKLSDLRHVAR